MAVTFHNATQTAGGASVGSRTILHTVSAAGAAVLVFTYTNASTSISAVGANLGGNSISFTRLGAVDASAGRAEVWGLSSYPNVATLSISINAVAVSLMFATVVVSYTGQRQIGGSPFGTVVSGTAQGAANNAFSVSSTTTDLVVYGFGVSGAPAVTITTGNNRASATASTSARLVVGDVAGAATVSISATAATANTFAFLAVPVVASAAAPTTTLAFDNAAGAFTTGAALSFGVNITATAGAVLLVWITLDSNTTISAVNVGSNQLGFLGGISSAALLRTELWGLTAAQTGVNTVSAIVAAGNSVPMGIGAVTYVGQKTNGNPFGGVAVTSGAATISTLSVSSTVGNLVVAGFGARMFQPISISAIPGMNQRLGTISYPAVLIADAIGGPAITVGAVLATATANFVVAINLIQAGFLSGAASMTDVRDKFSASGYVVISDSFNATDARDKFSASGQVIVSGRLSATDVLDKFSASGQVIVSGRLSATDVHDTFSATGYTLVAGRLSATDARDVVSISGYSIVTARLSATDAHDTFSASGFVVTGNVNGLAAFTDARDLFSASGQVIVQGSVSFTDRPDTFTATGITNQSAAAVAVQQDLGAGGGHGKEQDRYFGADDSFWDLREKYLKRIHKDISVEPEVVLTEVPVTVSIAGPASTPIDQGPLIALRASRTRTVEAIPAATNMRQLRYHGARLLQLNVKIAEQKRLIAIAEHQALLVAAAARKVQRDRIIRKAKRKVKMLAATQAIAVLSYIYDKLQ